VLRIKRIRGQGSLGTRLYESFPPLSRAGVLFSVELDLDPTGFARVAFTILGPVFEIPYALIIPLSTLGAISLVPFDGPSSEVLSDRLQKT